MPAERGPSGTGHDTACPKCGMPGAAYSTHVCMTAGEVPDPPATRWLNPPLDPPAAVPGPASPPADPVVSPADTIRASLDALFDADTGVAEAQDAQRNALAALDALLAVGERAVFLAEHLFQMIEPQAWRDHYGVDDGQGHYEGDYRAEQTRAELDSLRAVLAGEEDAGNG